jgi:hypothetical protein
MQYHEIFEPWFVKDVEGQKTLVKTAISVYNNNSTRCIQVLEKLWQMGIVSTEVLIQHGVTSSDSEESISHKVLTHFTKKAVELRGFLVTLHRQRGFLPSLINPQ